MGEHHTPLIITYSLYLSLADCTSVCMSWPGWVVTWKEKSDVSREQDFLQHQYRPGFSAIGWGISGGGFMTQLQHCGSPFSPFYQSVSTLLSVSPQISAHLSVCRLVLADLAISKQIMIFYKCTNIPGMQAMYMWWDKVKASCSSTLKRYLVKWKNSIDYLVSLPYPTVVQLHYMYVWY